MRYLYFISTIFFALNLSAQEHVIYNFENITSIDDEHFLAFQNRLGENNIFCLDGQGEILYSKTLANFSSDFKWHPSGFFSTFDMLEKYHLVFDQAFQVIDTVRAVNGYSADQHDLLIDENFNRYILCYDIQTLDLSEVIEGGQSSVDVIGFVIQKLDENNQLVFQWESWDHFEITDAVREDFTQGVISYTHANSLALTADGDIIVSTKHMDEITCIDGVTGEKRWRLGGKNNQFTLVNDSIWFNAQHDARVLENGNITLFDNGTHHNPPKARAVEYELDLNTMTATLVWSYTHEPLLFTGSMGSVQRLENGNTLISYGNIIGTNYPDTTRPHIIEVSPNGDTQFKLVFAGNATYRANKYPRFLLNDVLGLSGISEPESEVSWSVSNELLHINFIASRKPSSLRILDLQGKLVKEYKMILQDNLEISIAELKSGMYLCAMDNGFATIKFFKK